MSHIKIFADSTCDLSPETLNEYSISIVPLYVTFQDQTFRDGVDLVPEQLYAKVTESGKLPKTAAPSPADFITAFTPHIERGEQIIYISLSSHLSSTYQNAIIAAEEFEEGAVTVFDSLNLSTGIGIQVLAAARAAQQGKTVEEIVDLLSRIRPQVDTEFIIDSLDYLHKGGRCSGMQNFVGSLLKIRPVIKVEDGKMTPAYKVRGSRDKAFNQMLNNALGNLERMDKGTLFVTHSLAKEDAESLRSTLLEMTGVKEILITDAGCVISSHCGPKTIGIIYLKH
ncbi:fatty acid-binding protein DegV [Paenibacillus sp. CAA11]|uniref:DegV family protein n=1 Tax=Paenibacillus sp. CAA11 TaxID=1532905 RepID=UPI000D369EA2|nr:DegV family protein [Paenibacillus sp. CAA11]AWB44007.1 fatty acid-binding protein DegV [Paenibacillus sp. CAA11]